MALQAIQKNHNASQKQSSIHLRRQSARDDRHVTCLRSIFVKTLALLGLSKSSEIRGKGYLSFLVSALSFRKSTQRQSEPSFFLTKRTGAPNGELDSQMNPLLRLSSINSQSAFNSDWERE